MRSLVRFRAGQSGNRNGRPSGAKNRKTIVAEIARETHTITEDGRRRKRSTLELVLLSLRNKALDGNVRAFRAFRVLAENYGPPEPDDRYGYLVVPAPTTRETTTLPIENIDEVP